MNAVLMNKKNVNISVYKVLEWLLVIKTSKGIIKNFTFLINHINVEKWN